MEIINCHHLHLPHLLNLVQRQNRRQHPRQAQNLHRVLLLPQSRALLPHHLLAQNLPQVHLLNLVHHHRLLLNRHLRQNPLRLQVLPHHPHPNHRLVRLLHRNHRRLPVLHQSQAHHLALNHRQLPLRPQAQAHLPVRLHHPSHLLRLHKAHLQNQAHHLVLAPNLHPVRLRHFHQVHHRVRALVLHQISADITALHLA